MEHVPLAEGSEPRTSGEVIGDHRSGITDHPEAQWRAELGVDVLQLRARQQLQARPSCRREAQLAGEEWDVVGVVADDLMERVLREVPAVIEERRRVGEHVGGLPMAAIDLRAAMQRLEPDDRALLAMRYGAGFNSNELALATGKSPAATRQRLKRLLDRLREDLSHG